ncbi:HSP90 family protein [Pseudonocardia zijingensis]|uniref:HSP90 family protein n=1 Tax=Pseudonocardia zijingensis TaxID=153376 RepID=UPI0031E32FC4
MEHAFQVDLRGVVDLLSRHLYTGPRVYVRELLQNAVDAIAARRLVEPDAPAAVDVVAGEVLEVHDSGIGLTEDEVHELLATIGRSSKRDDFGFARHEFLGQFGIGLLSCFLVADQVRVTTRSARGGQTVVWTGFADGRYTVTSADGERARRGTTVTLAPRRGMEHWLGAQVVTELATAFGSLLPVPVTVNGRAVNEDEPPWQRRYGTSHDRTAALSAYGESLFGFTPFDVIDLRVPAAGLSGVAFVLPMAANPAERGGHRVYLRRMLLAEDVPDLLPEWAFFVRCVVDTSELRPTAGREALYADDLLADTREAIGAQLRDWLVAMSGTQPRRLQRFLQVHHLGVKALAVHDDAMLRVVDRWWPMETNLGPRTLAEFRRTHPTVRYTATAAEFRELAAVAAAQGIGLVNGGYTYDIEIMKRVPELDPAVQVRYLEPADLTTTFAPPDPVAAQRLRPFVALAEDLLAGRCAVVPRTFDPPAVPALYLVSRAAVQAGEMAAARESADDLWSGVLAAVDGPAPADDRPQLVLNLANPLVRRIAELPDATLTGLGVQALYGQALLQGHHPLHTEDSAVLNQALLGLLDWTVRPGEGA